MTPLLKPYALCVNAVIDTPAQRHPTGNRAIIKHRPESQALPETDQGEKLSATFCQRGTLMALNYVTGYDPL